MMPYKMNSNTGLENSTDLDFNEFLHEYLLQTDSSNEPVLTYEDGEQEAEWLSAAGFSQLTKPFEQGLEVRASELDPILATLSKPHAEAIRQRVRALNHTVRGRTKSRQKRKPDIRDVFRDFDESSTGTRSRSATPDSLDSIHGDEVWNTTAIPNFVNIFDNSGSNPALQNVGKHKQKLRRTPSAPLKGSADIFRGSHVRCDIPFYSADGIELLGFSRIGTIHIPRVRSGSDPSCSIGRARGQLIQNSQSDHNISSDSSDEYTTRSSSKSSSAESTPQKIQHKITLDTPPHSEHNSPSSRDGISFESMYRESSQNGQGIDTVDSHAICNEYYNDIDIMTENDIKRLQPIFWLELATLFDKYHVTLDKRKPFKRRRKEEGNLFGVSLNALIRRDQQITGKDSTLVPLFLEYILQELIVRGVSEEGILRVAGHKQKTEILYNELEAIFYQKPKKVAQLLSTASVHDLSALLKRWLRELPQPLLTNELIQLFYQTHSLPRPDQFKALAIVCQLLPHENRNTLRSLLKFLNYTIEKQESNKMTIHNVATIIAPSFFPPRYIHPTNKNSIEEQVKMAAQCCTLTSVLITRGESLFQVPKTLIAQSKCTKARQGKRAIARRTKVSESVLDGSMSSNKPNSKNSAISSTRQIDPSHVHRIVL